MKPTKTNNQTSLWDYCRSRVELDRELVNGFGPYKVPAEGTIERYFDCVNYDECLSFASGKNWSTFSCRGCRKVVNCKIK